MDRGRFQHLVGVANHLPHEERHGFGEFSGAIALDVESGLDLVNGFELDVEGLGYGCGGHADFEETDDYGG